MAKSRNIAHAGAKVGMLKHRPMKKGGTLANRKIRLKLARKNKQKKRVGFGLN